MVGAGTDVYFLHRRAFHRWARGGDLDRGGAALHRRDRAAGKRGRLAGMFQFNIVFGIIVAFMSNALLAGTSPSTLALDAGRRGIPGAALFRVVPRHSGESALADHARGGDR
jgi:hypothetical protein